MYLWWYEKTWIKHKGDALKAFMSVSSGGEVIDSEASDKCTGTTVPHMTCITSGKRML